MDDNIKLLMLQVMPYIDDGQDNFIVDFRSKVSKLQLFKLIDIMKLAELELPINKS